MSDVSSKLTVLFEDPFWIGLYERRENGRLEVCKITFGAEPKDWEVYEFMLANWSRMRLSPPIKDKTNEKRVNPKRMQKIIRRQTSCMGMGTKSQQALKLQHELLKTERKTVTKEQRKAEADRRFELRQEKRREKHKGR
ncbi:MAG: YjdF family protein [Oscillospiraceae bacterium]|nr:YjdF family protein [Oscillospiraceae bacterium]